MGRQINPDLEGNMKAMEKKRRKLHDSIFMSKMEHSDMRRRGGKGLENLYSADCWWWRDENDGGDNGDEYDAGV